MPVLEHVLVLEPALVPEMAQATAPPHLAARPPTRENQTAACPSHALRAASRTTRSSCFMNVTSVSTAVEWNAYHRRDPRSKPSHPVALYMYPFSIICVCITMRMEIESSSEQGSKEQKSQAKSK